MTRTITRTQCHHALCALAARLTHSPCRRFIALSREPVSPSNPVLTYKTSIVFSLAEGAHAQRLLSSPRALSAGFVDGGAGPGMLFKALSCFALRDIDLTKIER